jgi:hypothetical protein
MFLKVKVNKWRKYFIGFKEICMIVEGKQMIYYLFFYNMLLTTDISFSKADKIRLHHLGDGQN